MTASVLTGQATAQLFTEARTHSVWQSRPVDDDLLKKIYELVKFGPTSANCTPLRIVFIKTPAMKEKLKPALMEGNIEKTMTAPVTAILAQDMKFYDHLPFLFPYTDAKSWFAGNEKLVYDTALRNSSLQAGYFIMAARALGLDCGAMSGFDAEKVNGAFFAGTSFKVNLLCNIGYGDASKLHPRAPRLDFDAACKIV